jgi:hypothetical protein
MISPIRPLTVERYTAAARPEWDAFVTGSKNGTFLLLRGYMDYHADRFHDCSLLVRSGEELVALLPAHREGNTVSSHMGLTYGGLILSARITTPMMLRVFDVVRAHLAAQNVTTLVYKSIPHIYHRLPAEEDRYALFRHDAELYRRDLLSTIDMARRPAPQERRRRGAAKAMKAGVAVTEDQDWPAYWDLLDQHLRARYDVRPVHNLAEIRHLRAAFPDNIRLFTARDPAGALLSGVVIYETDEVAHLQYGASTPEGFALGCMDRLFLHLLDEVFAAKRWFDFGNSTEQQGRYLNDGLIEQKEGFGGRAVAHDYFRLKL